jgi:hypothetical protein
MSKEWEDAAIEEENEEEEANARDTTKLLTTTIFGDGCLAPAAARMRSE